MTTQEIKSAIASTISGQGNQVDLGGKLEGILNGLLDTIDAQSQTIASQAQAITDLQSAIEDVPKPIILNSEPLVSFATQAELDAIGLTVNEMEAATRGERTLVLVASSSAKQIYTISSATYAPQYGYSICFLYFSFSEHGTVYSAHQFTVTSNNGVASCSLMDI